VAGRVAPRHDHGAEFAGFRGETVRVARKLLPAVQPGPRPTEPYGFEIDLGTRGVQARRLKCEWIKQDFDG